MGDNPENLPAQRVRDVVDVLDSARNSTDLGFIRATLDSVLDELSKIASTDILGLFNDAGGLRPISEIPANLRRCIQSFEVEEIWAGGRDDAGVQIGVLKKVKLWDKNKGLEMLGRHFKMFTDKTELSADTLEAIVAASYRAAGGKPQKPPADERAPHPNEQETI